MLINPFKLSAQKDIPDDFCISVQEKALFDRVNNLREDYGKNRVEYSASLSFVAKKHVLDLLENSPDTSVCNLSSWSDKGNWTPCCFNHYVPDQDCMWEKPKELTSYPYRGYELVSYFEDTLSVDSVINLWSDAREVLDMILTDGNYSKKKWICMGVGMNAHYVSVWFGQRSDKFNSISLCNDSTEVIAEEKTETGGEGIYYVIFGSYLNTRDAKEAIRRLNKNEFDKAGILKSKNKIRVYLNKFTNIKEAVYYKQNLPYTYREAWVYKE
jgi:hypothetical protein